MNKKLNLCIALGTLCLSTTAVFFSTSHVAAFNIVHSDVQVVTFNDAYAPTSETEYYVTEASKTVGYTTLNFTKVKAYRDPGGFCALDAGGTITKTDAFNALSTFRACGYEGGKLLITTSFSSDFSSPYEYSYTLQPNFTSPSINVVGNYLKITADSESQLSFIMIGYGCLNEDSSLSGVKYCETNDYIALVQDDATLYADVKLNFYNGIGTVKSSDVTMRENDNVDSYSIPADSLTQIEGNYYTARFNISQINWNSGLWTQYTYVPRIYVNDKRVEVTENGNIYVKDGKIDVTTTYVTSGNDCAYKLGKTTWGSGPADGFVTISWINNVSESTYFNNKGVRFMQMGISKDSTVSYEHDIVNNGDDAVYFYVYGWVASLQEAELISGRYDRFTMKSQTSYTSEEIRGSEYPCAKSKCKYEAADNDNGYKITLAFDIKTAQGTRGSSPLYAIMGLYYDGLPYMLRGDSTNQDNGLLHTTAAVNKENDNNLCNGVSYGSYNYQPKNFWDWICINLTNA